MWSDKPLLTLMESEDTIVDVTGKIARTAADGLSHLTITLNTSLANSERLFSCWVNGISSNGKPITLSRSERQQQEYDVGIAPGDVSENTALVVKKLSAQIQKLTESVDDTRATLVWYVGVTSLYSLSTMYNGRIYLATHLTTTFDMNKAESACKEISGYLAELDDDEEYKFVDQFVKRLGGGVWYMLGATDADVEGVFVNKISRQPVTIDDWMSGQPNDHSTAYDQVCLALHGEGHGLNDMYCEAHPTRYVCEVPFPLSGN